MLLWLLDSLSAAWPAAGWARQLAQLAKITPRAALAALTSFALALWLGPRLIGWLKTRFQEPIKSSSETVRALHQAKQRTPTMGGLFIVAGLVTSVLVFGDWNNGYLPLVLLVALGLALVGAADDLAKLKSRSNGLSVRAKFVGQVAVAGVASLVLYLRHSQVPGGLELALPLAGEIQLGLLFLPLAATVIVGVSNAVNLTDGLDGLAGGCLVMATGALAAIVYASGHAGLAEYLHVPSMPGAGEMLVVAGGMMGGVLGFLWFNCHPAQVFMGDTGSLPLGGLLGLLALIARQEFLLVVVGGVFVAEAASVLVQVGWYRWRRKRVLRCAPLHHHFEFKGWPETKIVVRFWIAAALCAIVGVAGLKLRIDPPRPSAVVPLGAGPSEVRR